MTEPIKLPPDVLTKHLVERGMDKHAARVVEQWANEIMRRYVEQATADLRAGIARQLLANERVAAQLQHTQERIEEVRSALENVRAQRDRAEAQRDEALRSQSSALVREQYAIQQANQARTELAKAQAALARLTTLKAQYDDLILSVGNKYPGESRHETAKRYIHRAERMIGNQASAATTPLPPVKEAT